MRSSVHERGLAEVRLNMTPLIDVVFLLMIFFLLVAQIQRATKVEMDVPSVRSEAAYEPGVEDALVINVVPRDLVAVEGGWYRLGTRTFGGDAEGLLGLEASVREGARRRGLLPGGAAHANAADAVMIRADRGEDYDRVEPLFGVLSRVGLCRAQLVVRGAEDVAGAVGGVNGAAP